MKKRSVRLVHSVRPKASPDGLFKTEILENKDCKLRNLLPPQNAKHCNLSGKARQFNPVFKTDFEIVLLFLRHLRFHDVSFITF